jgi:hypothetical protein
VLTVQLIVDDRQFVDALQRIREDIARAFTIPRWMLEADANGWRGRVEQWRTFLGARAGTIHVSEGEWLEHWRAGHDPIQAVLAEVRD